MEPKELERMPVLRFRPDELPDSVIVVGEQDRADWIAESLDDAEEIGRYREYVTHRGTYKGVPIAVASHGVGAAGAAICFEELCRAGAKRILRVGTAGGMQKDVLDGHLVIASGAVRDDGVTQRIVPLEYPAVPSQLITRSLSTALRDVDATVHEGIVVTSALFYPHEVLGNSWEKWHRAGVVAVEMECAALFVIASQYRIHAGAILAIDGNPLVEEDADMSQYDPHRSLVKDAVETAFSVALKSLTSLEQNGDPQQLI
jgi:uridine phosphorylase